MKLKTEKGLNAIIDKLTNSIENVLSGDSFKTDITYASQKDLKAVSKKNKWQFDWKKERKDPIRHVFKLTIVNNQTIIQGLMSLEIKKDHVYMHLIESAPFNLGTHKVYAGVPGNLVAYACKISFLQGFEGNVSFVSKTQLIEHYVKTLGAFHAGRQVMIIDKQAAFTLIHKYF